MRRKAAVFLWVCALGINPAAAQTQPRIASTSLCGDGYVLALAPARASALSWQSRDPISRATASQKKLPQVWDSPERLVAMGASHILFGPGEGGVSAKFLSKTDMRSHTLIWGEDFAALEKNLQDMAAFVGLDAAPHIKDLNMRLAALTRQAAARPSVPKVLYLSRAGGTAGTGTYVDAAITAAGGQNVVTGPGWHTLSPENIIALAPDVILTSFFKDGYESINADGLRHKVLGAFMQSRPRANIPGALWPCAGPGLIEAAEQIAGVLDGIK